MKFFKSPEYYNSIKISANDARGILIGIDLQLDELLRECNKVFDEYMQSISIAKNSFDCLLSSSTDLETDQVDERHFVRVGGESQRANLTNMENVKKYISNSDKSLSRYFDVCERIRNLMNFRSIIANNCKVNGGIAKSEKEIKLSQEMGEEAQSKTTM